MLLFSAEYNIVVFITNNKNAISYLTNLCLNLINLSISVSSLLAQLILNVTLKILCREIRSHDNNSQIDRNDKWKIFLEGNNPTKSYLPLRTQQQPLFKNLNRRVERDFTFLFFSQRIFNIFLFVHKTMAVAGTVCSE